MDHHPYHVCWNELVAILVSEVFNILGMLLSFANGHNSTLGSEDCRYKAGTSNVSNT